MGDLPASSLIEFPLCIEKEIRGGGRKGMPVCFSQKLQLGMAEGEATKLGLKI